MIRSGILTLILVFLAGGFVSAESAAQNVAGTVVRFNKAVPAVAADSTHQFAEPVPASLEVKVANKRMTFLLDEKTLVTDKAKNVLKAESLKYGQNVAVGYLEGTDKTAVSIEVQ